MAVKRVERAIDDRLFCVERSDGLAFVELQGYRDPVLYWRIDTKHRMADEPPWAMELEVASGLEIRSGRNHVLD